jgi:hypothetical protein
MTKKFILQENKQFSYNYQSINQPQQELHFLTDRSHCRPPHQPSEHIINQSTKARSLLRAIVYQSTTAMTKKFIPPYAYNLQRKLSIHQSIKHSKHYLVHPPANYSHWWSHTPTLQSKLINQLTNHSNKFIFLQTDLISPADQIFMAIINRLINQTPLHLNLQNNLNQPTKKSENT